MTAVIAVSNGDSVSNVPAKKTVVVKSITQWYSHSVKRLSKGQAKEFLTETRAFLHTEAKEVVSPIFRDYDLNKITAEDCTKSIFGALIQWQANGAMKKAVANVRKKNWTVVIMVDREIKATDNEPAKTVRSIDLEESFEDCCEAEGWAFRRLVESQSDAAAIITAKLEKTVLEIDRHTALWRLRTIIKHPFMKIASSGGGKLGFGHKARDHRVHFSHG